jgi:serine protease AprX
MRIRLLAVFFFLALTVASVHSNDYQLQTVPRSVLAKIDPWVLEQTAAKGQAEFLVVLADQADLSAAERLRTKEEKGWYVYRALYGKAQDTQKPILDWLKSNGIEHQSFYIVNMIWVKGTIDVALTLGARPDVRRIDGNPIIHNNLPQPSLVTEKTKPFAPETISSGVSYSHAPQVWAIGYTGQGTVVGTADTGFQWDHPALKPHYRGWNGMTMTASHDYNWHDSIHSSAGPCPGNSPQPCYDLTHGTHTIGTAIGDDGGSNQIGMAPGAKFIGCRNMDQGNGTPTTYAECFQFFLAPYPVNGTPAQGDPTKAPDVTTHSWGCPASEGCNPGTWSTIQQAIQANRAAGIVTVVAAGNSGSAGCSTVSDAPSFFPEVVTVGALNTGFDVIASFSSRGPVTVDGSNRQKPDITAPGTSTYSSVPINTYFSFSGTSMATPHVAGAVALTLSSQPSLRGKVSTIEAILKDSAVHLQETSSPFCSASGWPNNTFGYGRLDALAAANMALTTFSPQSAAFTAVGTDASLQVFAPAGVNWIATTNDSWITINNGSGTGNGSVDFTVRDNPDERFRVGTITVAHRDFIVRQEGFGQSGCSYALTPTFLSFPSGGGAGSTTVVTTEDCIWTATSNAGWITITSDNGGLGTGTLTFTVGVNSSGASRKGTINISGTTFSVKQKFP